MKKRYFFILLALTFLIEIIASIILINNKVEYKNDTVKLNELINEIKNNFNDEDKYPSFFEYAIIDNEGNLIYKTNNIESKSLNQAYQNRDTIIDLKVEDKDYKVLVSNDVSSIVSKNNTILISMLLSFSFIQLAIIILFFIYIIKTIIKPFDDLKGYALRIANGNLDIPLTMDKGNNFGAFTESFDIMREELKKARQKEKEANDSKRELVAKLSHDIKTPIASIKSSVELGYSITDNEKDKELFNMINNKVDQINTLVSNLLTSAVEDLSEININPISCDSYIIYDLVKNSDYLNKVKKYSIDNCKIFIDRLRLQQVIDNIISNSYKYANSDIEIKSIKNSDYLILEIRDFGNGVKDLEVPLVTEKFKRGSNTTDKDGVGLGLYISKTFINAMDGILEVENANPGFKVILKLRII